MSLIQWMNEQTLYIHTMECYLAIIGTNYWYYATTVMNLRSILLSKKPILKSYKLYNSIYVTFSDNYLIVIENSLMVGGC